MKRRQIKQYQIVVCISMYTLLQNPKQHLYLTNVMQIKYNKYLQNETLFLEKVEFYIPIFSLFVR